MKILISFCNQAPESDEKNLLLYDLKNDRSEYLLDEKSSFTGLAQDAEYYYAISQGVKVFLVIIKKHNKKIFLHQELPNISDPHSMIVVNKNLYIASSGTDSVTMYRFNDSNKSINFVRNVWTASNSEGVKDTHHVNSVFQYEKDIYVSAFGTKEGIKWSSATHGYVKNISKEKNEIQNIYHPHSLFVIKDDLYYCESSSSSVKKNNDTIIQLKSGYVRGLSLSGRYVILGVSGWRKVSKSTKLRNNSAEAGMLDANCKVLVYKKKWHSMEYERVNEISFFPQHVEIYDILVVE